jgi:DNA polymerase (family 10)
MNLTQAQHLAQRIVEELQPYCSRIEVAGSIRRAMEWVNDIDLVLIPDNITALRDRLLRRCTLIQDGPQNISVRLPAAKSIGEVQLDLFLAHPGKADLLEPTPTNWGTILLCRTGSKEHNIKLAQRASHLGLMWKTYEGIFTQPSTLNPQPRLLASATEEAIFKALQMDYLEPKDRL